MQMLALLLLLVVLCSETFLRRILRRSDAVLLAWPIRVMLPWHAISLLPTTFSTLPAPPLARLH